MPPSAAWCVNARPPSSSSGRCRIFGRAYHRLSFRVRWFSLMCRNSRIFRQALRGSDFWVRANSAGLLLSAKALSSICLIPARLGRSSTARSAAPSFLRGVVRHFFAPPRSRQATPPGGPTQKARRPHRFRARVATRSTGPALQRAGHDDPQEWKN